MGNKEYSFSKEDAAKAFAIYVDNVSENTRPAVSKTGPKSLKPENLKNYLLKPEVWRNFDVSAYNIDFKKAPLNPSMSVLYHHIKQEIKSANVQVVTGRKPRIPVETIYFELLKFIGYSDKAKITLEEVQKAVQADNNSPASRKSAAGQADKPSKTELKVFKNVG